MNPLRSRTVLFPLLLALAALFFAGAGGEANQMFRYSRAEILAGEWWRLVTGHLLHLGWSHLVLNLVGLALVWLLVGPALGMTEWLILLIAVFLGTSSGLLFFEPGLDWYVGLSGVLHGILLGGALGAWCAGWREARLVLVFVAAKLAWEQGVGPLPGSEAAADGPVIVAAHLYGALSGVLAFAGIVLGRRFSARGAL